MLADKVLKGEGVQNVFVILSLVILAVLVCHDDCTCSLMGLASLKVVMVKRVALEIEHS